MKTGPEQKDFSDFDKENMEEVNKAGEELHTKDIQELRSEAKNELNNHFLSIEESLEGGSTQADFENLEFTREKKKTDIEESENIKDVEKTVDEAIQDRVTQLKKKFPDRRDAILTEFAKTEAEFNIMIDEATDDPNKIARIFGKILQRLKKRERKTEKSRS